MKTLGETLDEEAFQAINKVSPSEDSREPSLQTLATLIQDDEFYSAILYVNQAFSHNDNPDEMITAALPAIQSHPIFFHLGLAYRDEVKREEYQRQMDAAVVTYELFSVVSLGFETAGSEKWYQGKFMPFVFVCTQADRENTRDMIHYHLHAAWRVPPGTPLFTVELLQNLCPNNPFEFYDVLSNNFSFDAFLFVGFHCQIGNAGRDSTADPTRKLHTGEKGDCRIDCRRTTHVA